MNQKHNIQKQHEDEELDAYELWQKIMYGNVLPQSRMFVDGDSIIEREVKAFEQKLEMAIEQQMNDQFNY